MNTRARNIVIAGASFLIIALISGIITLIINLQNQGKPELTIQVSPTTAQVTVNGKSSSSGTIRVPAGKTTITVEKDGFEPKTVTTTAKLEEDNYIGVALLPKTDAAKKEVESIEERHLREGISSNNEDVRTEKSVEQNPIITELPYLGEGLDYRIDYGLPADPARAKAGVLAIEIDASTPEARQAALDWIRSIGENPSNYEVVFTTYKGPIKDSGGELYEG
jgi:hypothetical protein